ncbi:MAG: hypothetical protein KatS3mg034_1606 [Vicingaceae bacterium]|nr:MAG: hypothetical protein KatS3mg034_1606 [Vicingaceae bacterium]
MKKFLIIVFSLLFSLNQYAGNPLNEETVLTGQSANDKVKGAVKVRLKPYLAVPNYVEFREGYNFDPDKLKHWINSFLKNENPVDILPVREEPDVWGWRHIRYAIFLQNKPIEFADYKIHIKDGKVKSLNGDIYHTNIENAAISISEQQALQYALNHIGASIYKWEVPDEEQFIKWETGNPTATFYPKAQMVWIFKNNYPLNGGLRLAYKFDIYAHKPLSRRDIYVDAATGEILFENNKIHTADSYGTAVTAYSGTKTITTDSISPTSFRLRESARGNGIQTFNMQTGTNYGAAVDFTDSDNYWNNVNPQKDQYATDAHWGAEVTYDFYWINFNRNSIDNQGFTLKSYVHYDVNFVNAFWDGQRMTYGDGNNTYTPLTSLDIAGHEITHGLTSFTANLVYQNESGALNESFSDIFAAAIEKYGKGAAGNWLIGEDIGAAFRNMANPNQFNDPDTYYGTYWYTGTADNGGVHTNSGVQNFWFYLLTTGGSGTNDIGNNYSVTGQGIAKAQAIAFRNLTVYLSANSQYIDARFYSIQSAVDLYGACTPEVEATTNAWYACGVGQPYSPTVTSDFIANQTSGCVAPFTVQFTNNSVNGNTFYWDFGDGNTSTQVNPSHTYTSYGTFNVKLVADGGSCGKDSIIKNSYINIDTANPCIVVMPANGAASTQYGCSGTIYDSGGPNGPYGDDENSLVTISPTGAASITLTFPQFDVEQAINCIYDYLEIYDGPGTSSPLIGKYCNGTPPPNSITSNSGAVTIKFYSDQAVTGQGFQINWQCNYPTSPPVAAFTMSSNQTCDGTIQFTDQSTNGPVSWLWNFGDGNTSTLQNPSHTYTYNGNFTVTLTASNSYGSTQYSQNVTVNMPTAPAGVDDTVCVNQQASLYASGSGTLKWYDAPSGGNLVYTGTNFTTPPLQSTTSYYVSDYISSPIQFTGAPSPSIGNGSFHNASNQGLIFDVFNTILLDSVTVYPNVNKNLTIELRNSSGSVLQSVTVPIQNVGMNGMTIPVGFVINPGNDYVLTFNGTAADMYRNNSGVNYPYQINGLVSIKNSTAGASYYYYYYNWRVRTPDCISPRTEVKAVVQTCTGIDENYFVSGIKIYPNPAKDNLTIQSELPLEEIRIMDISGKIVYQSQYTGENTVNVETHKLENGVYLLEMTTHNGWHTVKKFTKN